MSGSAHAQSADEDERTGSDGSRRRMNKEGLATSAGDTEARTCKSGWKKVGREEDGS